MAHHSDRDKLKIAGTKTYGYQAVCVDVLLTPVTTGRVLKKLQKNSYGAVVPVVDPLKFKFAT